MTIPVATSPLLLFLPLLLASAQPREDIRAVSLALDRYTQNLLMGDLWKRPDLSRRDRSIVTLAALISRGQTGEMSYYLNVALVLLCYKLLMTLRLGDTGGIVKLG